MVRIINSSKSKFLSVCNDGSNVSEDDLNQLWIKGDQDKEGYFTLKDLSSQKVLTAVSDGPLKVEGMH